MNFLAENCTFDLLSEDHLTTSEPFNCGDGKEDLDLNEFFTKDFIAYSNELLGKTYCFTLNKNSKIIVCAFSIANDSIKTTNLNNNRKRNLTKKIPHKKRFLKSFPAVLIGRLGVNKDYKKKNIGTELMDFIKSWFVDRKNKTGCRFIVVDSYNRKESTSYYEKNGFKYLFNTEEEEKEYFHLEKEAKIKTRLMFFDLITLKI